MPAIAVKILPIYPLPSAASSMADAGPWRLAHLMRAPHRLAFAAGATMLGWALRYGRWLGRPRADGRPG